MAKTKTLYKGDFHMHSTLSHDGGVSVEEFHNVLKEGLLDVIAITDHNEVDFAIDLHKELGKQVIVGEEIKCQAGDVIGLFVKEKIDYGRTLQWTIDAIKEQGALVYVPHPLEVIRDGIGMRNITAFWDKIDIIEVFNARCVQPLANRLAQKRFNTYQSGSEDKNINKQPSKATLVGSDSHRINELTRTYNILEEIPQNPKHFMKLISDRNIMDVSVRKNAYPWQILNPKLNKLKKLVG